MKIEIISVGSLAGEYRQLANHYFKMIKWKVKEKEIEYSKKLPENQIKNYETNLISQHIKAGSYNIVLDMSGKQLGSEELGFLFQKLLMQGTNINIIIGGAFGLGHEILEKADLILSLSKMTFPHQMAKLVVLEQLYRAQAILEGHPYHK